MNHSKRYIPGFEPQSDYEVLLNPIKSIFNQKSILDLACYTGYSTNLIKKNYGAKKCVGVDLVPSFVDSANQNYASDSVKFIVGSVTDRDLINRLVQDVDIVVSFGAFYHFYNHFELIQLSCQPHVEFLILDTLYGPETSNPSMVWTYQSVINDTKIIPKGAPNISWIMQACNCFGFKLDYVHRYYTRTDFENIVDTEANKRMTMRFFNSNIVKKDSYFDIDQVWEWSDLQLIQKI